MTALLFSPLPATARTTPHFYQNVPILPVILVIGLLLATLLLIRSTWRQRPAEKAGAVIVGAFPSLLTPAELRFYHALHEAIGHAYLVLCKIRIADLLKVTSNSPAARAKIFRRIAAKHIDFVLASRHDLAPVLAIELDDSSHERTDRIERDRFLDEIFAAGRFPLLHVKAAGRYSRIELAEVIEEKLGIKLV